MWIVCGFLVVCGFDVVVNEGMFFFFVGKIVCWVVIVVDLLVVCVWGFVEEIGNEVCLFDVRVVNGKLSEIVGEVGDGVISDGRIEGRRVVYEVVFDMLVVRRELMLICGVIVETLMGVFEVV